MPVWLWLLLGGAAIVAVAPKPHVIDEAAITAVTKHALMAETDPKVLRKLQDLLSHSGRFELATMVKARADAFEELQANLTPGAVGGSIHASRTVGPSTPAPVPQNVQAIKQKMADITAKYQEVMQTPYALTHPAFRQLYTQNTQKALADLQAQLQALGG